MRRVAVVDEEEIFRLGIVACLAQDPTFEIVFSGAAGPLTEEADVAVVSAQALARHAFECPVVVCANVDPREAHRRRGRAPASHLDGGAARGGGHRDRRGALGQLARRPA